jgi:FtsZ-interacting cell division protein ZipA
MPELRWILLGIGAVVVIGLWLYGAMRNPRPRIDDNLIDAAHDAEPPELTDVLEPGLDLDEIEALGRSLQRDHGDIDDGPHLILVLHVARPQRPIVAIELFPAFEEAGLTYGSMDIFHHALDDGREAFSVANMVEPGTFDPTVLIEGIETPGVTLFAVLPGPLPAMPTFERMLSCGRRLAEMLGADLLDENRNTFTKQTEAHLRERIAEFQARLRGKGGDA